MGDVDSGRRTRLDDPLDQQKVISPHHGVAGDRQLFGQSARRRQSRARSNARATDGVADLIDHLRRQGLGPRSIQKDRNLHIGLVGSTVPKRELGMGQ
jgi:hypothetical protein